MVNKENDITPYFLNENINKKSRVFTKDINGTTYYFKSGSFLYNELLTCELYSLLNIPCCKQTLIEVNNKYLLMSKSFRKDDYNYLDGFAFMNQYLDSLSNEEKDSLNLHPLIDSNCEEYFYPYNSLKCINDALLKMNINFLDIESCMETLVKYYSMSVILLDNDFHPGNWEIELGNNHASVMPKYDNESIFSSTLSKPMFLVDSYEGNISFLESIKYFFLNSSAENIYIFKKIFELCDENLLIKAMNNLEFKYGKMLSEYLEKEEYKFSKNYILRRFSSNRDEIISLMRNMEFMGR